MKIDILSTYQTDLFTSLPNISTVEFKDAELGSGAYGAVHEVTSINNSVSLNNPKMVVKIFKEQSPNIVNHLYKTTVSLQKAIKETNAKRKAQSKKSIEQYPALKCLPLISFEGILKGKNVRGYLCQFLDKNSFSSFGEILDTKLLRDSYNNDFTIKDRVVLSLNLIEGFEILKECGYIHADLNPSNFFIDNQKKELVVIDYDSGAMTTSLNSDPQTFGKKDDSIWMSPQIISQVIGSNNSLTKINFLDDIWSVTVAIHFLLSLQDPFCYLAEWTPNNITDYARNFHWPNVNSSYFNFNRRSPQLLNLYCNRIQQLLPKGIYDIFNKCFDDGLLNPAQRPTYFHWENCLKNSLDLVKIKGFTTNNLIILQGDDLKLFWKIENASKIILLPDNLDVTNLATITLAPQSTTKYQLEAYDSYGGMQKSTAIDITVNPKPTFSIQKSTTKILHGECFSMQYTAANFQRILIKDVNGKVIKDISGASSYVSSPMFTHAKYIINVLGKYGGEIRHEISVEVFEAPSIDYLKADCIEAVDSMAILFDISYKNASEAQLFCNGKSILNVLGKSEIKYIAENKSQKSSSLKFELIVTGFTGTVKSLGLPYKIIVYPQPSIQELSIIPDKAILYSQEISLSHKCKFVEKMLLSDGILEKEIVPNSLTVLRPVINTTYKLTPIGKLGFKGNPRLISVEVFRPIEIEIYSDKRITLPTVPVTISWKSMNHSKIILEPGNIDVTGITSKELIFSRKTTVVVWGINKKDRKKAEVTIEVLQYPKFNKVLFANLPPLSMQFPNVNELKREQHIDLKTIRGRADKEFIRLSFSKIFEMFTNMFKFPDLAFNKDMRLKLYEKLKNLNNV